VSLICWGESASGFDNHLKGTSWHREEVKLPDML